MRNRTTLSACPPDGPERTADGQRRPRGVRCPLESGEAFPCPPGGSGAHVRRLGGWTAPAASPDRQSMLND